MALDFPNTPTNGQQFTGPNGIIWVWDGVKWTAGTQSVGYASTSYVDAAVGTALHNVGRNLLHNGLFNIAQRGVGPFTTAGAYTLDRWWINLSLDTNSVTAVSTTDADRTAIGDEGAIGTLQSVFVGNAGAGAFSFLSQKIEKVRRLAGQTVTVSFWAKAVAGTPKIGINIAQNFGTGGSPSSQVRALATGNAVTLTTSWARYSSTVAIPSIVGKTLGTAGDDSTQLELWLSSGASLNASAGNIGVQSGTIQLWGVQLELGSVATPLEKLDPRMDLANCQRFYCIGAFRHMSYQSAGNNSSYMQAFPVDMRAAPTVTPNYSAQTNCTGAVTSWNSQVFAVASAATALGFFVVQGTFTASADL